MKTTIRIASPSDAADVAAIYAPSCETNAVSFEYVPPSPEEMARRIETVTTDLPWLILEDAGVVAGYAYASRHRERAAYGWAVDTAIYVSADYRRRGVGRALYTALFQLLRLQGYFNACAGITLPNPSSIGLHEAAGFTLVGIYRHIGYKLGAWHDVAWYQASVQPERSNPGPPLRVSSILGTSGWNDAVSIGLQHYRTGSP
jgi:phosphinothricin acetyltransferase